jgi:hypothetical protein
MPSFCPTGDGAASAYADSVIRPATRADEAGIRAVATAHDLAGFDSVQNPRYQALLRDHGRLVVAEHDGEIVGFGGMIIAGGAAMITDLFVFEERHGRGDGTAMTAALLEGFEKRMTFSSRYPLARATYARAGMEPQWYLRYLRGRAPVVPDLGLRAVEVAHGTASSDRPELVAFFDIARCFHLVDGADVVGHAIVRDTDAYVAVDRLVTSAAHDAAMAALLREMPADRDVEACVPEPSPANAFLRGIGFDEVEYDLHMASEPGLMPDGAVALNPGLA